jgi:BolA protein
MKVQSAIESRLKEAFDTQVLQIENESHRHNVPANSETHFKVTLVCPEFEGQSKVKRHQAIYKVLAKEMAERVHALSLHLYSVDEWAKSGRPVPESPNCMGGSVNDPEMAARLGQGENS